MPKPHHFDSDKTSVSDSSQKFDLTTEEAGKENGADEIEITMSQKAGVGIASDA
jgi:hypothetical protein